MERIPPTSPWYPFVSVDAERMSGEPVFRDTRVLVQSLFDYLKGGEDLATFLDDFEGVTEQQARGVLALAAQGLLTDLRAARAAA